MLNSSDQPKARTLELILQRVDREVVVYDLRLDRAMHLNAQLTEVWDLCDGQTSVTKISEQIAVRAGGPVTFELVQLALAQLRERDLLVGMESPASTSEEISRRDLLKKACVASLLVLPALSAITVPSPAAAASGVVCTGNNAVNDEPDCCPCTAGNDCISNCCGFAADGVTEVCVALNSMPNGAPCRAQCNCVTNCCGPAGVGCVTPNSIVAGQPCRQDCNCVSGSCTGSVCDPI